MKRALYINKFHVLHKGHVNIIRQMNDDPEVDEIVLGIGSMQYDYKNKSPERDWIYNYLTWEERKQIIEKTLRGSITKPVKIIPIMDFHPINDETSRRWIEYIMGHCPEFDIVYTNHSGEKKIFSKLGKEIKSHEVSYRFTDHCIRDKIARKEVWQPFFEKSTERALNDLKVEERLAELYGQKELGIYSDLTLEWRTFDKLDSRTLAAIRTLPEVKNIRSQDCYIYSLIRTDTNFKVQPSGIKIKTLLKSDGIAEYWNNLQLGKNPDVNLLDKYCRENRFFLRDYLTDEDYLKNIPRTANPYLFQFNVLKLREMRADPELKCGVDITGFVFNNDQYLSLGIEAKSLENLLAFIEKFGLSKYDHLNYLQFFEKELVKNYGGRLYERL
jgi:nicotinamide mononucleotide adenylyltransferase